MLFYKLENGRVLNVAEIVDYNDTNLSTTNGFLYPLSETDRLGIESVLNQKRLLYPRTEPLEVSVTTTSENLTAYEPKKNFETLEVGARYRDGEGSIIEIESYVPAKDTKLVFRSVCGCYFTKEGVCSGANERFNLIYKLPAE
jgi:hypothetical protein